MANFNEFDIVCPASCPTDAPFTTAIEEVDVNCQSAPTLSEIYTLLLMDADNGTPPVDWTNTANWATAIDNTDLTGAKVKQLIGQGGIEAAERPTIEMAAHKDRLGVGVYTLTFTVKSITSGLYNFLRGFQCGSNYPKFWYASVGGYMYGKQEGIQAKSIIVDFPKEIGRDAYDTAVVTITWDAQTDPERIANPLA